MAKRKRKSLSKRQRFEVFKRDSFTCQYCGRKPPEVILEADHMVPVAAGGEDHESNMVTACKDCNAGKSDRSLDQVPPPLAGQMQDRRDSLAQLKEYNEFLLEAREHELNTVIELGVYWCDRIYPPEQQGQFTFGKDRKASVHQFLKHIPAVEIMDAIDLSFARVKPRTYRGVPDDDATFRYFCGICWKKIRGDQ